MRQFADPTTPARLDAQKLWPSGERSPEGADFAAMSKPSGGPR